MSDEHAGQSAWHEYRRRRRLSQRPHRRLAIVARCAAGAGGGAALVVAAVDGIDRLLWWAAGLNVPGGLAREAVASAALAGAVLVLARNLVDRDADAWRIGAAGEQSTADALTPLTAEGWRLLHDRRLPDGNANVDHIVVGPGGVWVIETKAWRGRVVVGADRLRRNGTPADRVYEQVWRQARAVSEAAGVEARPVLCLTAATVVVERDSSGRLVSGPVEVHGPDALVRRLRLAPVVLSGAQVDEAARLIDRALPAAERVAARTSIWSARGP
jgi:hypothetical protein